MAAPSKVSEAVREVNGPRRFWGWPALLLRLLPKRLAQSVYYRLFRPRAACFPDLFRRAPLGFAPGMRMDLVPGDECHGVIAFTGVYELALTRFVVQEARGRGGVLVDVGANFGYYSLLWAGQGAGCRAMAFEASPQVFPGLLNNVQTNPLSGRVKAHFQAISDREGVLPFQEAPPGETGSGRLAVGGKVEVAATTLDRVLARINEVAILKIDAEGHDFAVLCGARDALRRRVFRHIFWEAFPSDFDHPQGREFCRIAAESGYEWAPMDARACGQQIIHAALREGERA